MSDPGSENHVLCESCRMWRVCSVEYYTEVQHDNDPWFCFKHPSLEDCKSKKRRHDRKEKRKRPSMQLVSKWFEASWKYLYAFAKINNITDYELKSWAPFLKESSTNYLLSYLKAKDSAICPHGDGKWKFFGLLTNWLNFHSQWMSAMELTPPI